MNVRTAVRDWCFGGESEEAKAKGKVKEEGSDVIFHVNKDGPEVIAGMNT